jgi:tetratricopeptide (TPR) repeat protein
MPARKTLPLLRAAVAAAPQRRDLRLELVMALFARDRMAELVDYARPLVADREADPQLLYHLGRAALVIGDYDLAIEALRAAAENGHAGAFPYLSDALLKANQIDAAIAAGLEGLEHPTQDFRCLTAVARAMVLGDQVERLWKLCVDLHAGGARGGYFPAVFAFAADAVGRADQVAALLDPTRWYSATQLEASDDFNAALAAELLAHKSRGAVHSTTATRGTSASISHLERCSGPLAERLLEMIRTAVQDYIADRHTLADPLVMTQRPKYAKLESWVSEVRGDGFQLPHIHASGWISGVYYVTIPKVNMVRNPHAGAIEFGLLSFGPKPGAPPVARWRVMPRPGLLLLFPSYFAHWTRRTETEEPRICVAFDVVPAAEAS